METKKVKASSEPLPHFTELNDLACERVGGKILFATDDFFAVCENVIKHETPVWKEGVFTEFGKWMDGWETRRKRTTGHDWCILQLAYPAKIYGVDADTSHFTGNYPPRFSIQAACLNEVYPPRDPERQGTAPNEREMEWAESLHSDEWESILPMSTLKPGHPETAHNYFDINSEKRWTHLRVNLFPDGGLARLRVFGVTVLNWANVSNSVCMDMAAMTSGGVLVGHSNAYFGHVRNLIEPQRARNMGEGWETARRLDRPAILTLNENLTLNVPGSEWAMIQLGHACVVTEVEVDTHRFKGNAPDSCYLEGCYSPDTPNLQLANGPWKLLMPVQKLKPHTRHWFRNDVINEIGTITHVRFWIAPDGGVSRLRVWGYKRDHE